MTLQVIKLDTVPREVWHLPRVWCLESHDMNSCVLGYASWGMRGWDLGNQMGLTPKSRA